MAEAPNSVVARGLIDNLTTMFIYGDGTFTTKVGFGKESGRDRLLGFDHDVDSMRRKSATGRGAAAFLTGGASLIASNNRGVLYVTVMGEKSNVRTFTTRNPSGTTLSSIRSLKAAADMIMAQVHITPAAPPASSSAAKPTSGPAGEVAQLKQLADLHLAGVLTAEEFRAAKSRLLGT